MGFFRHRGPKPLPGLRKDSETPMGTIWTVVCPTAEAAGDLAEGDLLDAEHLLDPGDIINVRQSGTAPRRFALVVRSRDDDVVHCERLDR